MRALELGCTISNILMDMRPKMRSFIIFICHHIDTDPKWGIVSITTEEESG